MGKELVVYSFSTTISEPDMGSTTFLLLFGDGSSGSTLFPDLKEIALTLGPFGFTIVWASSWFDP